MAVDRAENKATDIGFMAKAYLSLGGVHVDVYCIRWHVEKEKGRRVASFLNATVVGVKYSVAEQALSTGRRLTSARSRRVERPMPGLAVSPLSFRPS